MNKRIIAVGVALFTACAVACMGSKKEPTQKINEPGPAVIAPTDNPAAAQPPARPEPKPGPTAPDYAAVNETATLGVARVRLAEAGIGKVPVETLGRRILTDDDYLYLIIQVENLSDTKKLDFKSWNQDFAIRGDVAGLTDNLGNRYKRVGFGITTKIVGQSSETSIYPKTAIVDVVVFELPVAKASTLFLELPGQNCSVEGVFKYKLEIGSLKRKGGEKAPAKPSRSPDEVYEAALKKATANARTLMAEVGAKEQVKEYVDAANNAAIRLLAVELLESAKDRVALEMAKREHEKAMAVKDAAKSKLKEARDKAVEAAKVAAKAAAIKEVPQPEKGTVTELSQARAKLARAEFRITKELVDKIDREYAIPD